MHPFDIAILDAGAKHQAVVYARHGMDVALATLPLNAQFKALLSFRQRVHVSLLKNQARPIKSELTKFGHDLFEFVIRGSVHDLYARLPVGNLIRIHILTNRPELQTLPWEYLQDPSHALGPMAARSIVRIVPTIGQIPPAPLALAIGGPKIRILFV